MRKLVTGAGVVAVAVAATLASATPASATPSNEGSCLHPGRSRHPQEPRSASDSGPAEDRLQHAGRPGQRAHLRRPARGQLPVARPGGEAPQDQPRVVRLVRLSMGA